MPSSRYIIRLSDLAVPMSVGLCDWEREEKQRVIVNVEMEGRAQDAPRSDIKGCIDYSRIHAYVTKNWPDKPHTELLETLAEELMAFCLSDPLVQTCRVRLSKPDVFKDSSVPEVELYREQAGLSS